MASPIPIHAVRKQAELCLGLLCDLESAVARGRPLDQLLAQYYRRHREFGSRDRRFFSALAFAWFRWRGWLSTPSQPNALDGVVAWLLDAPDLHPAVELLAGQLPPAPFPWQALGSMALPDKAHILGQWQQRPPLKLDALVPGWFADALYYPDGVIRSDHLHLCLQSFQVRPSTWLRIRAGREPEIIARLNQEITTQKTGRTVADFAEVGLHFPNRDHRSRLQYNFLPDQACPATTHPRLPQAVCIPTGCNLETLQQTPHIEIQDLASQCVGLVCAPDPGESWWDACAGSGGKSFHLADLMNGQGSILATDIREHSLRECRRRMLRNHAKRISLRAWDGAAGTAPDCQFDGVLLDAPCSGLGTWHRNPDARWRTPPETVARQAALQSSLLRICAGKVRSGGRLVYSVCTLADAETSGVIEGFLAEHRDFRIDSPAHPLTGESTQGPIWIWPWQGNCNGMFIAVMLKKV